MKKLSFLSLLLIAFTGCQIEELETPVQETIPETEMTTYYVGIDSDVVTRTSLSDEGKILWSEGDKMNVFFGINNNEKDALVLMGGAGTENGSFYGPYIATPDDVESLHQTVIVYPYDENMTCTPNEDKTEYSIAMTVPSVQQYAKGSFGNGAYPMVGVTKNTKEVVISTKNLLSGMNVKIKGDVSISKIVLTSADLALAGPATVVAAYGKAPVVTVEESTALNTVELVCDGVQLNSEEATEFHATFAPCSGKITVTIYDTEGGYMTRTTKATDFTRNDIFQLPELTYVAEHSIQKDLANAFKNGGEYTLPMDVTVSEALLITGGKTLNLNLNGYTLTSVADLSGTNGCIQSTGAELNIANGKINNKYGYLFVTNGYNDKLHLELTDVDIKGSATSAFYFADATEKAYFLVSKGGAGHTSVLYTDERSKERIDLYSEKMPSCRVLINSPSSQGGIGDLYNFKLEPSLTLGCGSWGGNAVSGNVGVENLLNYKTVAERRENMLWFKVPPKVYFKRGALDLALRELQGKKRAFIVTDSFLFNSGAVDKITKVLDEIGIEYQVFFDVKPDPTLSTIRQAMEVLLPFQPDTIISLGGGSPMDAAKIMWLLYEQPEINFEDIAMRFMDIRKRICQLPELGKKALMVAIPTTSGTGSEVTPFSIITDDKSGVKYAIADYALTPNMAIVDPNFVDGMPKGLTSASGIDALVHAIEAYVSCMATNFTNSNALEATKLVFKYLERSYSEGANDPIAREKMHYAATIAGMAFANSFLGLCHSMAHKLGAMFNVPHGVANALLIRQIIKYNAIDCPKKQATFPQYKFPNAKAKYGQIADNLGLGGKSDDEKVELLISAVDSLMKNLNLPNSIKDFGVTEEQFYAKLDEMVELAFDDQCTGANPVYPIMSDMKQIYIDAFEGVVRDYYSSAKKSK